MFTQYQEQGPDYISAMLNGYKDAPKGFNVPAGGHYNEYFPGHVIAMPPPSADGQVTYRRRLAADACTTSKDVAAFLMWVAEPQLDARKRIGFQVMIFLIVLAGLMYFTKKKVWSKRPLRRAPAGLKCEGPREGPFFYARGRANEAYGAGTDASPNMKL